MAITLSLASVECLWDQGRHNGFTDLIYFNDVWYCAFRQADHHMSFDGHIVILSRKNNQAWLKFSEISWVGGDLYGAKICMV